MNFEPLFEACVTDAFAADRDLVSDEVSAAANRSI
jgi:hypothetical protein